MRKSTQTKLINMSGNELENPMGVPATSSFIKKMLHYPDAKEGAQIVAEHARLEFEQTQGKDIEKIKALQIDLDSRFKAANATQEAMEDRLKNSKQYIKCGQKTDQDENSQTGFLQMGFYDQCCLSLLFFAIPTSLFMGAANVYSNLMASGEDVFMNQPYLAVFISLLVPAGSTAIKFISNFFEYQSIKKRYALFIYGLTASALLLWSGFFAMNYTGVASGIDLSMMNTVAPMEVYWSGFNCLQKYWSLLPLKILETEPKRSEDF